MCSHHRGKVKKNLKLILLKKKISKAQRSSTSYEYWIEKMFCFENAPFVKRIDFQTSYSSCKGRPNRWITDNIVDKCDSSVVRFTFKSNSVSRTKTCPDDNRRISGKSPLETNAPRIFFRFPNSSEEPAWSSGTGKKNWNNQFVRAKNDPTKVRTAFCPKSPVFFSSDVVVMRRGKKKNRKETFFFASLCEFDFIRSRTCESVTPDGDSVKVDNYRQLCTTLLLLCNPRARIVSDSASNRLDFYRIEIEKWRRKRTFETRDR